MVQPAAVGVAGAEVGCPETDDGRTLTARSRDGRGTERTQRKQRETDTQTVSNRVADAQSREALIKSAMVTRDSEADNSDRRQDGLRCWNQQR